jgi:hypothetical protein
MEAAKGKYVTTIRGKALLDSIWSRSGDLCQKKLKYVLLLSVGFLENMLGL